MSASPDLALPSIEDVDAELAARSLADFTKQAWHIVEPATPLKWNWHLDALCDHLQALLEGTLGTRNLLCNIPPGCMKSMVVSAMAVPWWWVRHPEFRATCAAGVERIALRDSVRARLILDSGWYRSTFQPSWVLSRDQNAKGYYVNSATGFRVATTAGSGITGDRPHGLFVDDPLDAQWAHSEAALRAVTEWWDQAFANRVADPETSVRVLIMQRLNEEDLTGHIIGLDDQLHDDKEWTRFILPMEFDPERRCRTVSLGWEDPRQAEGELLFPARYNARYVRIEKLRLGSVGAAGQLQQQPTAKEGNVFKRGHVRFIAPADVRGVTRTVVSWDTAFKEGEQNDYSVALLMQLFEKGIFVRARRRDRFAYPALKEATYTMAAAVEAQHGLEALLIEDKASGQSLVQEAKQDVRFPVKPVPVLGDKVMRAHATVPTWELGKVFLPLDPATGAPEPWCDEFLEFLYSFPLGRWKDDIDAFTQGVSYLVLSGGGQGFMEWIRQEIAKDVKATEAARKEDAVHHPVEYYQLYGGKTPPGR